MKAWRVYNVGDMRLDDIPQPEIRPGWVLVRTRMVQPSITEIRLLQGTAIIPRWEKIMREKAPFQAFGHEFCADVIEVGQGVENVKVGDRVFPARPVPCHECALCLAGYAERCRKGPIVGMDMPGCLAEYAVLPAECLMSIPESITDSEATAMQPLTSALEFVIAAKIKAGDTVIVLGQGVMGLNCMQLSRAYGAGKVIATDLRDEALDASRSLGADIVFNAKETDPVGVILEATEGIGGDVVFECAGGGPRYGLSGTKTLSQAINVVREEGKVVLVGVLDPGVTLDAHPVIRRGVQYVGPSHCRTDDLDYMVDLVIAKRVQMIPLITHIIHGLDKIPEAFEITSNKARYRALSPAQVAVV
jgi:threonine dehydrogenase-like Zn-dependent dehydrogenase